MTTFQGQLMSPHRRSVLGRTPQLLQFMRLTQMDISRVAARWLGGSATHQGRRKTSTALVFPATCHTSAVIRLVKNPFSHRGRKQAYLEGTYPGQHVSLLQSQPASGSGAIQKTPSSYPQEFPRIRLPLKKFTGQ